MSPVLHAIVLAAAMAGLSAIPDPVTLPAQVKDKDKEKDKKDAKSAADDNGYTEVYKSADGWRFRIKNAEGKTIAVGSIAFEKKDECLKAVDAVKTALARGKIVELKDEKK
jgi:uncharacterized protein YegP (UPF0339 family)